MPQVKQTFSLKLFASPHVNEETEVLSRDLLLTLCTICLSPHVGWNLNTWKQNLARKVTFSHIKMK